MPQRSRRSRAAKLNFKNRPQKQSENKIECEKPVKIINDDSDQRNCGDIRVSYLKQVSGHFHQGDLQFSYESRGVQCSCNALVMLCRIPTIRHQLTSEHLDQILKDGDYLYRATSQKLRLAGELHKDGYLECSQLPTVCLLLDGSSYTIDYESLRYCILEKDETNDLESIDVELQAAFNVSNSNILILGSYMMAIYRDSSTGCYIFFDSHSRNEFGFLTESGNSVALVFEDMENVHTYLRVLCRQLNITAHIFGIQSIHINRNSELAPIRSTNANHRHHNMENKPGCSTWTSDHFNCIDTVNRSLERNSTNGKCLSSQKSSKLTKEQKWYKRLPVAQKNEILEKKRKREKEKYELSEYANSKRLRSKQSYENPENAVRKREQSKQSYRDPKKAERKREQSKQSYRDPKKAERKREQSKQSYRDPIKAKQKCQQSQSNRHKKKSNIDSVIANFKKSCKEEQQLIYICHICQRIFFKRQVKTLYTNKYPQSILIQSLPCHVDIDALPATKHQGNDEAKAWICYTCDQNLLANSVPKLSTVNKLALVQQPHVLSQLNMLERHLVSPAILFMKMIPLIKGAQKGISGQVVCVKSNVNDTAACLPRLPTEQSLIRVKLKRQLIYKGHHMCQDVNPENIRQALKWLKVNNPVFEDIEINFDEFESMLDDELICNDHDRPPQEDETNETSSASIKDDVAAQIDGDETEVYDNIDDLHDTQYFNKVEINLSDTDMTDDEQDMLKIVKLVEESIPDLQQNNQYDDMPPLEAVDDPICDIRNGCRQQTNGTNNNEEREDNKESLNQVQNCHDETNEQNANENDDNDEDFITNTSAPLFSFLHPVDFAQYLADKHDESILCIAPGEGNIPEIVLKMEAKCFPVEFPDASNTFNEHREDKLSPSRYFNARIFSADNRFARNPEYIFFALYATEVQQIWDNISIALRRGNTKTTDGREITASMLTDREEVKKLIKRDEGYKFLAKIRGTPAYWEKSKKDVFAMIRQLGIPTFFVTFSAADRRWIEIDNAILISQGKQPMTVEQHMNMTWEDHCNIIMSNPAAAAKMFQERVYTFVNNVILSPANPIGKVEDYYYRTEFQQRGWPHIHMIVWVKDAPVFDEDPDEEIVEFIDKYISCELPNENDDHELHEIVSNVQMHTKRHTKSCRKTGQVCRFNFPKPPSNKTFICRRQESMDENLNKLEREEELTKRQDTERKAKDTLRKMWDAIESNEDTDFDEILRMTQITHSQFEKCLAILAKRNTPYLKRRVKDQWVNNYNPDLIRCWNANMDIQYILDPFAATMYMLSYLTKSEREMGDLLRSAQREAREGNTDAVSELKKLGSVYLQHREISVMGAIYLICSMPLKQSSRNVVFVQTDVDGQKISLPLQKLQDNAGNSEEVWMTSQIEKYIGRPKTAKYKNMCMAKFFSTHYQVSSKSTNAKGQADENCDNEDVQSDSEQGLTQEVTIENQQNSDISVYSVSKNHTTQKRRQKKLPIKLAKCSAKMKERTQGKPAVIRYPRVSIKRDKERYHMNMLRLYLPHTTEEIKPQSYDTYESYHLEGHVTINGKTLPIRKVVQENMKEFEPDNDRIDDAWDALQQIPDLQDAWNALNPQGEQQQLDDRLERNICDDSDDEAVQVEIPEFHQQHERRDLPRCAIETCRPEISEEQAESMMRQLNDKQRQLFNHVTMWCDRKARDHTVSPFRIFLTGGAGTGKSHVIRCITYYAKKAFASMRENADEVTVLLLAHTGTAAFNISGETICSALRVPAKPANNYTPLGEEYLNTLRMKYQHLQLVIIDEISMVSIPYFDYVHGRLQQIKGTSGTSFFGNVSILAVGDFYQLPPIRPRTPLCFPRDEILKDLWNPLFKIVQLTEIMRQRDDAVFAQMLNRLRTRRRNEPIDDADKQLLESRIISENGLSAPDDALHLFYTNSDVEAHNKRKIRSLNTPIYTIQAIDIDQKGGQIIKVNTVPHKTTRKDDTTLADELELAVDARVMLISNVDVSDGLCNGVSGIIKGIEICNNQNMPTVVYVKFDSTRIGAKTRTTEFIPPQYEQCIPIKPRKESFQLKGKSFTTHREQVPLKLSWAVTIHKVQGQTTDQAVISMKYLQKAMAYVALSRVTHLEGMYLTDFDEHRICCDENVADNIAKMPQCDLSIANPLSDLDHCTNFIIVHHNIQSLNRHFEDLKKNTEIRKAHVICLSETWLENDYNFDSIAIDGYTLESVNYGNGRGVAMYIQNSVRYNIVPLLTEQCDVLAIRTSGKTNLLIVAIYKPMATTSRVFSDEMNNLTAQIEILDTDHKVLVGDFNRNLLTDPVLPAFKHYNQVIQEPTTTKGTLLDHIYIKPLPPNYSASIMTTYYSYHHPTFVAIKY